VGILAGTKLHSADGRNTKKLIRAAVEVLTQNAPPPVELRLAWLCETWGTLPDEGGMNNQDYLTISRMTGLSNVYNVVTKWRNYTGEKIHLLTDHDRSVLRWMMDNGINFNA
jgi:hypothetical protein